jgi:hypothetical protein
MGGYMVEVTGAAWGLRYTSVVSLPPGLTFYRGDNGRWTWSSLFVTELEAVLCKGGGAQIIQIEIKATKPGHFLFLRGSGPPPPPPWPYLSGRNIQHNRGMKETLWGSQLKFFGPPTSRNIKGSSNGSH